MSTSDFTYNMNFPVWSLEIKKELSKVDMRDHPLEVLGMLVPRHNTTHTEWAPLSWLLLAIRENDCLLLVSFLSVSVSIMSFTFISLQYSFSWFFPHSSNSLPGSGFKMAIRSLRSFVFAIRSLPPLDDDDYFSHIWSVLSKYIEHKRYIVIWCGSCFTLWTCL